MPRGLPVFDSFLLLNNKKLSALFFFGRQRNKIIRGFVFLCLILSFMLGS